MLRVQGEKDMFGEDQFQDVQKASRKSALWTFAAFVGIVVTIRLGEVGP